VGADEAIDFFDEVGGGLERAAPDGALSDEGEEAFDLVEPGGVGRREMNVPVRTAGELNSDLGMLVGGVVVDDEMDVELGRHIGLDVTQEGEEFFGRPKMSRQGSSLVSHFRTASSDQFEIRILINNRLRLQFVVGQCVQGGLLLSLGVGDDQHSAGASQAYAG
jgi:hypothetical protein